MSHPKEDYTLCEHCVDYRYRLFETNNHNEFFRPIVELREGGSIQDFWVIHKNLIDKHEHGRR